MKNISYSVRKTTGKITRLYKKNKLMTCLFLDKRQENEKMKAIFLTFKKTFK